MKKILLSIVLVGVLVAAFATVGAVSAQGYGTQAGQGSSFGMGGRGRMADNLGYAGTGDGPLHEYLIAAVSEKLGVSTDVLEESIANGDRLVNVALEQGFTIDEFRAMMTEARTTAVAQAEAAGVITQEQAEWMTSRAGGAMRGGRGGFGGYAGDCPLLSQTAQ
jgi:hypothetical protein